MEAMSIISDTLQIKSYWGNEAIIGSNECHIAIIGSNEHAYIGSNEAIIGSNEHHIVIIGSNECHIVIIGSNENHKIINKIFDYIGSNEAKHIVIFKNKVKIFDYIGSNEAIIGNNEHHIMIIGSNECHIAIVNKL
jgi:hypothetical protein